MSIRKKDIDQCLRTIEDKINWGSWENWTTRDFLQLSEKIFEKTTVSLSVATLKRIWGKVAYQSKPTITTLDALAKYIDFENWRSYEQSNLDSPEKKIVAREEFLEFKTRFASLGKLLIFCSLLLLLGWTQFKIPEVSFMPLVFDNYQFSSMKMVTKGLPNSVIFDYDASASDHRDSIYIQQSWDKSRSKKVSRLNNKHNSIYYHPGYFKAKLVVRDTIVKEHNLFIKTEGWLPLIDIGQEVPIYFTPEEAIRKDGKMYISEEQMKAKHIDMHPNIPWLNYYYMADFDSLNFNNLVFETRIRNTYRQGSGICQRSNVELRFSNGMYMVPLSSKGCVSKLGLYDARGLNLDPSKLGVDFSDWVDIKIIMNNGKGDLFINNELAYDIEMNHPTLLLKGVRFEFQGGGEVDEVSFINLDRKVIFEESFN